MYGPWWLPSSKSGGSQLEPRNGGGAGGAIDPRSRSGGGRNAAADTLEGLAFQVEIAVGRGAIALGRQGKLAGRRPHQVRRDDDHQLRLGPAEAGRTEQHAED